VVFDEAASPCVGICRMDADDRYCVGCFRTRDEIACWSTLGPGQRRALNAGLADRRRRALCAGETDTSGG
jgi:uncharacterized protein